MHIISGKEPVQVLFFPPMTIENFGIVYCLLVMTIYLNSLLRSLLSSEKTFSILLSHSCNIFSPNFTHWNYPKEASHHPQTLKYMFWHLQVQILTESQVICIEGLICRSNLSATKLYISWRSGRECSAIPHLKKKGKKRKNGRSAVALKGTKWHFTFRLPEPEIKVGYQA